MNFRKWLKPNERKRIYYIVSCHPKWFDHRCNKFKSNISQCKGRASNIVEVKTLEEVRRLVKTAPYVEVVKACRTARGRYCLSNLY